MSPSVFLVGAGPGDPGLITVRGWECLSRADLVLYDSLANSALLDIAPGAAERICVGKHGQGPILPREAIIERMVEAARAERIVVRLKGGDPSIFGHLAEEVGGLEAAGIEYEIVPGVSAGVALGSYAALGLTSRQAASAVAFVTGQETADKTSPACDYRALAGFPGTLVFYMGVTTAPEWTAELMAGGLAPDTPALVVRRCTWPDQQMIRCRLDEVALRLQAARMRPPVLVVVGQVAAAPAESNWFERRPLHGQTIWLTRPRERADAARRELEALGATVLASPLIETRALADPAALDAALDRLADFDWLVLASRAGVEHFLDRLWQRERDARALGSLRIAAIGSATAEALAQRGLRADLVPDEYRAEALAEAFGRMSPQRILIVRASRGRDVLAPSLMAAGHQATEVVGYESVDVESLDPEIARALDAGRVDWITVTSSAIARRVAHWLGGRARQPKLASISPITSGVLREFGFEPRVEATPHTMEALIAAMVADEQSQ